MTNSTVAYQVWLVAAVASLIVPLCLQGFSYLLRKRRPDVIGQASVLSEKALQLRQAPSLVGKKTNVRFFSSVLVVGVLLGMVLLTVPLVGVLEYDPSQRPLMRLAGATVMIMFFAWIGILYSVKKKDISWLETYPPREKSD